MFKEILGAAFPIIEKVAPLLASVLGSPYAGMGASFALSELAKKFGLSDGEIHKLSSTIIDDQNNENKVMEVENYISGWLKMISPQPPTAVELNLKINW